MSMTKAQLKKFVEEDYKDCAIMVTCDNEHKFYHNVPGNPPIIWDWNNDQFIVLETNQETVDQNGHPFTVTMVALEEIQFITASIDKIATIDFINKYITDEEKKTEVKALLQKVAPSMMAPRTLKGKNLGDF